MKKRKKKSAPIFQPETAEPGKAANIQMALASPAAASAMASGYAGLGVTGSINEETDKFLNDLRNIIWQLR